MHSLNCKETLMASCSEVPVVRSCPPEKDGERLKKELAEDDIVEIFSRLPVKSLLRFRCVSKFCNYLIPSQSFIALHSTHSSRKKKTSLLFYSCKKNVTRSRNAVAKPPDTTTVSFGFGDDMEKITFAGHFESVEIVGCFNGVVCLSLSEHPQQEYALWNPATKKLRKIGDAPMVGSNRSDLRNIEKGWYGSGFHFDPVTNTFNIAQIKLIPTESGEARAQINVFSTATNSWTEKNVLVPYRINTSGSRDCSNIRGASYVNGYMHWHLDILHCSNFRRGDAIGVRFEQEDNYILSYNMSDEVFKRIEMPSKPVSSYYHLTSYNGSFAIFAHEEDDSHSFLDELDVWVLNDSSGANHSWSKLQACKPSIKIRLAVGFFRKDDIDLILLYKAPDGSPYLYDPETGKTEKFGKKYNGMRTFLYSESLAPLH